VLKGTLQNSVASRSAGRPPLERNRPSNLVPSSASEIGARFAPRRSPGGSAPRAAANSTGSTRRCGLSTTRTRLGCEPTMFILLAIGLSSLGRVKAGDGPKPAIELKLDLALIGLP